MRYQPTHLPKGGFEYGLVCGTGGIFVLPENGRLARRSCCEFPRYVRLAAALVHYFTVRAAAADLRITKIRGRKLAASPTVFGLCLNYVNSCDDIAVNLAV